MLDEQGVERDPVLRRHHAAEGLLGGFRGLRPHDAEPIRDPVHVSIDRDRRESVTEDQHAVRGLGAHPRQRGELLVGRRHAPPEPSEDLGRAISDRRRFRAIEADAPDQGDEGGRRGPGQRRSVRELREQPRARTVGHLVAGALRQDRADQHLERVLGVVAQVRPPPVAGVVERGEPVEHRDPVERARVAHTVPLRAGGGRAGPSRGASVPGSERSGSSFPPCASRSSSPIR